MKKILVAILIILSGISSIYGQDTISMQIGEDLKVIIYAKDKEALLQLKEVDFNQILQEVAQQVDTVQMTSQTEEKVKVYELNTESGELNLVQKNTKESTEVQTYSKNNHQYNRNRRVHRFWVLDLGLNNYLEKGKFPDANGEAYGLSPIGARYVAFGVYQRGRLGREKSPVYIQVGLEVNWYNFMFENDNYILQTENGVEFRNYQEDFQQGLSKSKLVVPYVSIPLAINIRLNNDITKSWALNFGVGGYVGYRVGAYSKVKFDKKPKREHANYFLNNWRYGLETHIGLGGTLLFFKYDLNELFVKDKGPELNVFSFGIRL